MDDITVLVLEVRDEWADHVSVVIGFATVGKPDLDKKSPVRVGGDGVPSGLDDRQPITL